MVICDRQGEQLLLTLSPEGVRFLREQWSWLRELVRWQLAGCTDDPLAEVTGLPVPIGTIDGRLAYVVDYWCGTKETGPVRQLWEGWVLHDLEHPEAHRQHREGDDDDVLQHREPDGDLAAIFGEGHDLAPQPRAGRPAPLHRSR